jgi:acetyl-CoA carboxylase/biotin carboxylase 1
LLQVEPVTATLLELRKLEPYKKLQYAPSRNRQYHMYTATERPDMRR